MPLTPELLDGIKKALAAGQTPAEIEQEVLAQGWTRADSAEAFRQLDVFSTASPSPAPVVGGQTPPPPPPFSATPVATATAAGGVRRSRWVLVLFIVILIIVVFTVLGIVYIFRFNSDSAALLKAQKSGDVTLCTKVSKDNLEQCIANVAIETNDSSLCQRLSNTSTADLGSLVTGQEERNVLDDFPLRSVCFSAIAERTKNVSLCEKITTDVSRDQCFFKLAVLLRDGAICSFVKSTERDLYGITSREECEKWVRSLDPSYCKSLGVQTERNRCFARAGGELRDLSVCSEIVGDERTLYSCQRAACEDQDLSCCSKLSRESDRISCVSHYAANAGNKEVCKMLSPAYQTQCIELVNISNP
ncbi:MAG: hypothetical protein HYT47_02225 [Candidatus Vogelbacteria bacterium]|nr:hypothetical protein [Candidatus Vogelbacteria bacterium]